MYAKVKSQEAYQQDWVNISQQPDKKFDDYYNRLEVAYDNACPEPEFREAKVKSRLLAEKFRDSIRDVRARESILDKGILDDTSKSVPIIAIAKRATEVSGLLKSIPTVTRVTPPDQADLESIVNNAVVAALQRKGPSSSTPSRSSNTPTKYWRCHYCNTTNHPGGWKACPDRRKYNFSWMPRRQKPKANRVQQPIGDQPSDQDFHQNP